MPDYDTLKNCWENNPDGAGFAYAYNGKVFIKKGFMTFDSFMDSLNKCDKKYNFKNCGVLLHFRIATHGGINAGMTHPFPIVDDEGCLEKIEYVSDYAVIHNGIISLTSYKASKTGGLSDTAIFIKDYLTKIAGNKNWLYQKCNMELIEELIDSKMAILDKNGNIQMTSGFTEEKGVFYSNSSYKQNHYKYYSAPSKWDWDDYYTNDFYIADRVDDSKRNRHVVELMELPVGTHLEMDGYSEDVEQGEDYSYYMDKDGAIYVGYFSDTVDDYDNYLVDYVYMGNGEAYDSMNREIEFKCTKLADIEDFCLDEYYMN